MSGYAMIVDQETTIRESAPRLLRFCRARVGNIGPGEEITRGSPAALIMHWRPNSPFHGAKGFPPWRKRKRKALLFPGALLQEQANRVSYGPSAIACTASCHRRNSRSRSAPARAAAASKLSWICWSASRRSCRNARNPSIARTTPGSRMHIAHTARSPWPGCSLK